MLTAANLAIWIVAALAAAGVVARPFRLPEATWAAGGAALLVLAGLLPFGAAVTAVGKGTGVYLFLGGMMLLSETARREGLFDWAAARAVNAARTSPRRLFLMIYGVGVLVTAFLSNDATAVVLTPAVYAVAKKAKVEPLPFLFACAFVANAAGFILPISNPANLVLYGGHLPPLGQWLARFALPSAVSIAATFFVLRWLERDRLTGVCAGEVDRPQLSAGGWTALAGIGVTALGLMAVSALGLGLGPPTAALGALTTLAVAARRRAWPIPVLRGVSWGILPLVAGLFVLVAAVDRTGAIALLAGALKSAVKVSEPAAAAAAGALIALADNLMNNLPAGLVASTAVAQAHPPARVIDALLIGVDIGPNLSITGSLATILWLTAIRREGARVGFWRFLKAGALVMPPALILALAARLLLP